MTQEIQTHRKGAWLRWYGWKSDAPQSAIDRDWQNFCSTTRSSARLVEIVDGKLRVVMRKPATGSRSRAKVGKVQP